MAMLSTAMPLIRTAARIGAKNAAGYARYRLQTTLGQFRAAPAGGPPTGRLLREAALPARPSLSDPTRLLAEAADLASGRVHIFGGASVDLGDPPDWHRNVLSGERWSADQSWWRTAAPGGVHADIKGIWEASRFDWLLVLARAARVSQDVALVTRAEHWLQDWIVCNPGYRGPNWKCGQETSIRLMQTLLAVRLLGQDRTPTAALVAFVRMHVARVSETRAYADAQDNNHATSEAFALFAGGAWLAAVVTDAAQAREAAAWSRVGRRWLEQGVQRLVFADGGFSQYSVNYHRVLLETLSQAELWRRHLTLGPFSADFQHRAAAATRWLATVVNPQNGDTPNLGNNDGARVYRLDSCAYRDHRPTVQLASCLFVEAAAFPPGPWDEPLAWLGLTPPPFDPGLESKRSHRFSDFGLVLLNPRLDGSGSYAFVRVPRSRFRPSQADPLHFDLWTADGINLLRDGGTFSYSDAHAMHYFPGIAAHNTIAFDGREPMPRISRFLFGDWIDGEEAEPELQDGQLQWCGRYRDRLGASHRRTVTAHDSEWRVQDDIAGFTSSAALHWRLAPGPVQLRGQGVETERIVLTVEADSAPVRVVLTPMPESRLYGQQNDAPGLEIEFPPTTRQIRTLIQLK